MQIEWVNKLDFEGVSIDTRTLRPRQAFVALKGPNFDGHRFVQAAEQKGAAFVVVEAHVDVQIPQWVVPDTRQFLGQWAAHWRQQFDIPIVAVTGSCGKTTLKEMIATLLAPHGAVLATEGNLNNDLGVPLTLLRLTPKHRYAVIEMGANHPGEIEQLTQWANPTVAVVNNAAAVHLEGFGDIAGVARAKGEIFSGLTPEGIAILNKDDAAFEMWRLANVAKKTLTFGFDPMADVTARDIKLTHQGCEFILCILQEQHRVILQLLGRHNVANALAAAACAFAVGVNPFDIAKSLAVVQAVPGRLQVRRGYNDALLIDDSYNANPLALSRAIDVLAEFPVRTILVLGDMVELGEEAPLYHQEAGHLAKEKGITACYTVGSLAQLASSAFGKNGYHFPSKPKLIEALKNNLDANTVLLIKGSHSSGMEEVVEALIVKDHG